jgi:hypothetical protein
LAGETEVLGENLPKRHFCPSQNPTWPDPGLNPGRRGGKPTTNRLSCGAVRELAFLIASCVRNKTQLNWVGWLVARRRLMWQIALQHVSLSTLLSLQESCGFRLKFGGKDEDKASKRRILMKHDLPPVYHTNFKVQVKWTRITGLAEYDF